MVKKRTATAKPRRDVAPAASDTTYQVVLRTRERGITVTVQDQELYKRAVAWNRMLASDAGRESDRASDRLLWQKSGLSAMIELAETNGVNRSDVDAFIASAAKFGEVQVEMDWAAENFGWAARVFPWESLIGLATKQARVKLFGEKGRIVVVRWLRVNQKLIPAATGPICFAVSAEAKQAGYDTETERVAIEAAIGRGKLKDLASDSLSQLSDELKKYRPSVLHYVSISPLASEAKTPEEKAFERCRLDEIAQTVAEYHPQLVAFSACYTGRQLAPLAVVHGAHLGVGFQGEVSDSSCAVFFGAFYREWAKSERVFEAVQAGLEAHNCQKSPGDLGGVTIWSATDLLSRTKRTAKTTVSPSRIANRIKKPEDILKALKVTCALERTLNYSMLHNKRGGLFTTFQVLKLQLGKLDDLEISVKIDTGIDRPVECHFFAAIPDEPYSTVCFMEHFTVPLGSELLRRRGEMLRGTVEVTILCGIVRVFHSFSSIELPPCDEWKDDQDGKPFLPSFIFPRDPAVRDILTSAQRYLRILKDDVCAGFDGYPCQNDSRDSAAFDPVLAQLRSIWGVLLQDCRLDYTTPPPSYTKNVQRVRTPEEIVRCGRGTCLELVLLLAACWEHIGLFPVIFLTKGHAFTGYWTSEVAWKDFYNTKKRLDESQKIVPKLEHVKDDTLDSPDPAYAPGGGSTPKYPVWLLRGPLNNALISRNIRGHHLEAVEATYMTKLKTFQTAMEFGRTELGIALSNGTFDCMIDVCMARDENVTPLAIMTEGVVS